MDLNQENPERSSNSQSVSEQPSYTEAEYIIMDPDPAEEEETVTSEKAPDAATGSGAVNPEPSKTKRSYAVPPAYTERRDSPARSEEPPKAANFPERNQEPAPEPKKKASPLSIVAFVGSFLGWLSAPAIILAVIDLVKGDKKRHKHGLSIAAVIVGAVMLLGMIGAARIRSAAQEPETVRPAQSQAQTQQAKTAKPAATKAPAQQTKAPAQQTEAPAPQSTEPPAAQNAAEEMPMVLRFEPPDQPAAYIESITLDGQGYARLSVASKGIQTSGMTFSLYYVIVREPEKGPVALSADSDGHIASYRQAHPLAFASVDRDRFLAYGPRFSDTAYARVFPGTYMQFFLLFNESLSNQIYWTSNPIYIPEQAAPKAPPFELAGVKAGFRNKDLSDTGIEYSFSSAKDLNQMLEGLPSSGRKLWDYFTFRPNSSPETLEAWKGSGKHTFTAVLYAPGFAVIGPEHSFYTWVLPKDGVSPFTCDYPSLFADPDSPESRPLGGYPAGTYVLAAYIDGAYSGGYEITLP